MSSYKAVQAGLASAHLFICIAAYSVVMHNAACLRALSQFFYHAVSPCLAEPFAERALCACAFDQKASMHDKLLCVWDLAEIYKAENKCDKALDAYKLIELYNLKRGSHPALMMHASAKDLK